MTKFSRTFFLCLQGPVDCFTCWLWTYFPNVCLAVPNNQAAHDNTIKQKDKQSKARLSFIAPFSFTIRCHEKSLIFNLSFCSCRTEGKHQELIIWFSRLCSFHFSCSLCIICECICVMLIAFYPMSQVVFLEVLLVRWIRMISFCVVWVSVCRDFNTRLLYFIIYMQTAIRFFIVFKADIL